MSKKQHSKLSKSFEARFPELFSFERCGLLMIDREDDSLFKVVSADLGSSDEEEDGMRTPVRDAGDAGDEGEPERIARRE